MTLSSNKHEKPYRESKRIQKMRDIFYSTLIILAILFGIFWFLLSLIPGVGGPQ